MKSEVIHNKQKENSQAFPRLMISSKCNGTSIIVMIMSESICQYSGIVVGYSKEDKLKSINHLYPIGSYHNNFQAHLFTDFNGEVKLSND